MANGEHPRDDPRRLAVADVNERTSVADPLDLRGSAVASGSLASVSHSSMSGLVDELAPTRLDRYALVDLVGRGSYGSVWAAFDPQLDRRVAIKVMYVRSRGDGQDDELQQMLGEAQMLAQVNHPSVVAIHDVRMLEDEPLARARRGLFIVMEFLPGPSLADWAEQAQPRPWAEVLAVYLDAGRGLAAAHRRGLVHRDFKPANVMFGDDRRVRVLDFGLARPTRDGSIRTRGRANRALGTPAYMAPEQHAGLEADARSDQYGFCVALFEALYGHRPFLGDDPTAIGKAKIDNQLQLPRGGKVPARILAVLRRGLAVDPEQRYPDMGALLQALQDDPVARRRRWAALGLLVAAIAGSGYGLARFQDRAGDSCTTPTDRFDGLWDDTLRAAIAQRFAAGEAGYADEVRAKVEAGLDAWTGRWLAAYQGACEQARAQGQRFAANDPAQLCLERARRRLGGLTATLVEADAGVLARATDAVAGLPRPESCIERSRDNPSAASYDNADADRRDTILQIEGEVARARTLADLGRYDEARAAALLAREHAEAVDDHGGAAGAGLIEAQALTTLTRFDEALQACARATNLAVRAGDPDGVARAMLLQLGIHRRAGAYEAAEAVALMVRAYIPDGRLGPELEIERDLELGELALVRRELEDSQVLLERALERANAVYGEDHPKLASIHNQLGIVYSDQDGAAEIAAQHYRRALELYRRSNGEHHPDVAAALNNLAIFHAERGDLDAALPNFQAALEINQNIFGSDSPKLTTFLLNMALLHGELGHDEQALEYAARAVAVAEAGYDDDHPLFAAALHTRARCHRRLGQHERAAEDLRRALAAFERIDGPTHPHTAVIMADLAEALRGQARDHEADALEALATAYLERGLPADAEARGEALAQLVRMDLQRGDHARALAHAEQHVAHLQETQGPGVPAVARAKVGRMQALLGLGRHEQALAVGQAALTALDDNSKGSGLWRLHQAIAHAELALDRRPQAAAALEQAIATIEREHGQAADRQALEAELAALQP